jgi:Mrp family chromosome partitioning ATPase
MSEQREVRWAKHLLANVHARMLGVILNMARRRMHVEYYYYYGAHKKVRERT